jgi:hypothetical protein
MKKNCILLLWLLTPCFSYSQQTPYEKGNGNQTTSYADCIDWYRQLAQKHKEVRIDSLGPTDVGKALHAVVLDIDREFSPANTQKNVVFIINGIHPGEPEGIDASMLLARDLLEKPNLRALLKHTIVVIVPIFNVDGSLQRNSHSRANQNGPEAYGFRGNRRNLDLNRDFIKLDASNTRSLVRAMRYWDPDLFIDTHTSNGADYPYVMTLIESQTDKMQAPLGPWMQQQFTPKLYAAMEKAGMPICPYVNTRGETPDEGIYGFLETPRYSSGYAALFHSPAYVLETHMLKPFAERLQATRLLLEIMLVEADKQRLILQKNRQLAQKAAQEAHFLPLNWQLARDKVDSFYFTGYQATYKASEVHGAQRLYYDRKQPWGKNIPYFRHYQAKDSIQKPKAYLIPQAWRELINRLEINGIPLERLEKDSLVEAEFYQIESYETNRNPYEGRYLHYNTRVKAHKRQIPFYAGDVVVYTGGNFDRFLVETLEPVAVDSYFNWGFTDGILQQKEYFSHYVFEDTAAELLRQNPALKARFDAWIAQSAEKPSPGAQLDWIYRNSPYFETQLNIYPIARILD